MGAANGIFNVPRVAGREIRTLRFRFFPNGTSTTPMTKAAATLREYGNVISDVTRTGTAGTYLVTTTMYGKKVFGGKVLVQHVTAADLQGQLGVISNEGSATLPLTFTVRVLAGATPTDITANADSSVFVDLDIEELPNNGS